MVGYKYMYGYGYGDVDGRVEDGGWGLWIGEARAGKGCLELAMVAGTHQRDAKQVNRGTKTKTFRNEFRRWLQTCPHLKFGGGLTP